MIEKKYLVAMAAIIIVFSVGLVAFFMFSDGKPDGLETIMEDNGVTEGEPVFHAPLDYGSGYFSTLLMGIIGFCLVLLVMIAYLILVRKRKSNKGA